MHSNFITPPDIVATIVIIDATADEIEEVAERCRDSQESYNVYLYREDMDNLQWLVDISSKADVVLKQQDSKVPALFATSFGPDQIFKSPAEYFTK
jgi:hypothetical protein